MDRRRPRQANQVAIARAAGVSVSTVSRALSNAPGISPERRSQILKLAREAGYAGAARLPAADRSVLTWVTASIATGGLAAFYDAIVKALVADAGEAGLALDVRLVDEAALDIGRLLRHAEKAPAAAGLFVGLDVTEAIASHHLAAATPLVLVNGYDPQMRFDCVAPNNFYGGMLAAEMLIRAGHRSLLLVEDHSRWTTRQRQRGFLAGVEGVPDARARTIGIRGNPEGVLREELRRRARGESDWTGVFCINDLSAIRVIGALEAGGLHVPGEVSVVGFDDLPYVSMMRPPLATMRVDTAMIGRQAIGLLLRRMAEPDAVPLQVDCAVSFKPGGTLAPPAQH